jgi:hypothetical membrane protein
MHKLVDLRVNSLKVAGALLFVAGILTVLGIVTAEATYPGYSVSQNYISDLGGAKPPNGVIKQPAATILDTAVAVGGLLIVGGAYAIHRALDKSTFPSALPLLLALAGIGSVGVGVFNESFGRIHSLFALLMFAAWGLAAIVAFTQQKALFRYFSVILGVIALANLFLYEVLAQASPTVVFLGVGGAERWVAYPLLLWLIGFGGYLMGESPAPS